MPDENYPSLNKLYAASIVTVGLAAGGFLAYVGIFNSSDLAASFLFFTFSLIAAVGSILIVYRASRLRVSDEGISTGHKIFLWRDVTEVNRIGYGIHLHAGDRKIVLSPYAYQNPEELMQFVEKALATAA